MSFYYRYTCYQDPWSYEGNINNDILTYGSRTAVTSKMERIVIIVNGFQSLTIITKRSILEVATVLDPPLNLLYYLILTESDNFYCVIT